MKTVEIKVESNSGFLLSWNLPSTVSSHKYILGIQACSGKYEELFIS